MASIERWRDRWKVRWWNVSHTKQRSRVVPDRDTAKRLQREIEAAVALGQDWEPPDARQVPVLLDVNEAGEPIGAFSDYMRTVVAERAEGTRRHTDRILLRFAEWLAVTAKPSSGRLTVDLVDAEAIEDWARDLRQEGLEGTTARLYGGIVKNAVQWMRSRRAYREWTEPLERVDLGRVRPPARSLPPTWAQMDAMVHAAWLAHDAAEHPRTKQGAHWRARLVTVLRFTGLRVEQAMALRWDDLDLEAAMMHVRPELGKSTRERAGRHVPISAHLVAELASWGTREGYLLAPHKRSRESTTGPVNALWRAAGVPPAVWAAPPGRAKGNPHHAFRKGLKTGLAAMGVDKDVRDYLVGHHRGIDETYVGLEVPAREAVAMIPPVAEPEPTADVIELAR